MAEHYVPKMGGRLLLGSVLSQSRARTVTWLFSAWFAYEHMEPAVESAHNRLMSFQRETGSPCDIYNLVDINWTTNMSRD